MKRLFEKPEVYADSLYDLTTFLGECYALLPLGTIRLKKKLQKHLQEEQDYVPFRMDIGSAIIILKNKREVEETLLFLELGKQIESKTIKKTNKYNSTV